MKLGINDYILKPFKPEELKAKMLAVLGAGDDEDPVAAGVVAPDDGGLPAQLRPGEAPGFSANRQFIDVLLVDDMENVGKKLRQLLPPHMTMNPFTSAQSALAACREKMYRVILIDPDLPEVAGRVLCRQLRLLQPHAAILAMPLHSTNDVAREMREEGFDDVLFKPFGQDAISDLLLKYFDNQDILVCEDNLFKAGQFSGKEERLANYYAKLGELYQEALKKAASACYDEVILDLTHAPARQEKLPRAAVFFAEQAKANGIELKLVAAQDHKKILSAFTETKAMPVYDSVPEARAGAGA
jgi:CheY-like chemotaxis protein